MSREGSTLSPTIRDAWDGAPLGRFLAREQALIIDHHVGLIGHITREELRQKLTSVDAANGYANRFLWLPVRRARLVPFPGNPRPLVAPLLPDLRAAIVEAQRPRDLRWTDAAADLWETLYVQVAMTPRLGLAGHLTARAEAHIARLALVYALLDRAPAIDLVHLEAGMALWDFARRGAVYLFGESVGSRHADLVLRVLRAQGEIDRATVKAETGLRLGADLDEIERLLVAAGIARVVERSRPDGTGRRRRVLVLAEKGGTGGTDEGPRAVQSAFPSHASRALSPVSMLGARTRGSRTLSPVSPVSTSEPEFPPVDMDADPGDDTAVIA
jgi:hypothetical protein